jgi:putative addiction module component (TIGR02574 family)
LLFAPPDSFGLRKNAMAHVLAEGYGRSMSLTEIKNLPIGDKLQIMEAIWEDLRSRFDRLDISPETAAELDARRARVERGDARLVNWDEVKGTIGRV